MARLLTKMRVDEVSGVPIGAGEGVKVRLLKQDDAIIKQDGLPPKDSDQAKERAKSAKKATKEAAKASKKRAKAELKAEGHREDVEKVYVYRKAAEGEEPLAPEVEAYLKREFTEIQRQHLAQTGAALPGGGYPITDADDLHNAISSFGRASSKKETRSHIMTRARALGRSDLIPNKWRKKIQKQLSKAFVELSETITKSEGGEDFTTELAEMQSLDYGEGIIEAVHDACHALKHSIEGIMEDDDTANKGDAIRESFGQFIDYVIDLAPDSDVAKSVLKIHHEDNEMTKVNLEGLVAKAQELRKGDPNLGELAAFQKAFESVGQHDTKSRKEEDTKQGYVEVEEGKEKELADSKGKVASVVKEAEEAKKDWSKEVDDEKKMKKMWKGRFEAMFKMSPEHREWLFHKQNDMDDDAKKKFVDMKDDEKDDEVKKNSIEAKIAKAMEDLPEPVRKRLAAAEAAEIMLQKMGEEKEVMQFTKKAEDLKVSKELVPHFIALHKAAPEAFEAVEQTIKALVNQVNTSRLFQEFGSADVGNGSANGASAYDTLMAKAEELRKAQPNLTTAQAFAKVYSDPSNREVVQLHKSESRPRN